MALGLAAFRSQIPPDKRAKLPYCREHESDAFARRDAKYPVFDRRANRPPRDAAGESKQQVGGRIRTAPPDIEQGSLF